MPEDRRPSGRRGTEERGRELQALFAKAGRAYFQAELKIVENREEKTIPLIKPEEAQNVTIKNAEQQKKSKSKGKDKSKNKVDN